MTFKTSVAIHIDPETDAGYIRLRETDIAETVELTDLVLLDLDEFKVAAGIEVLSLAANIPFARLHREFHVPSATVELVRQIQPTLGTFLQNVTTGGDSTRVDAGAAPHGRRRALSPA